MLENIQPIIDFVLSHWQDRPEFEGAILGGSYAKGRATEKSDIDLDIYFTEGYSHIEEGSLTIRGKLVNFTAYPIEQKKKIMLEGHLTYDRMVSGLVAQGIILMDKNGAVKELHAYAKEIFYKPFPDHHPGKITNLKSTFQHVVWAINDMNPDDPFLNLLYYTTLQNLMRFYAALEKVDVPANRKLYRFFFNEEYRQLEEYEDFKDQVFKSMFVKALTAQEGKAKVQSINNLYRYVMDKIGPLPEENFMYRYEVDADFREVFDVEIGELV